MNILCFGAHPDDMEICCGGTLAKYSRQGHKVFMAIATNGDKGDNDIPPEKMAEIRFNEAKKSASLIGAELIWLNFEDEALMNNMDTRLAFVDAIRAAKPDIIICPSPNDYHIDHRITSQLVFEAASVAFVKQVKTKFPGTDNLPPIYYMDTLGGVDFNPEEYVDITDELETKIKMLSMHESQTAFFKKSKSAGQDLFEVIKIVAQFRGIAGNVQYAEGFKKANVWRRGISKRILP